MQITILPILCVLIWTRKPLLKDIGGQTGHIKKWCNDAMQECTVKTLLHQHSNSVMECEILQCHSIVLLNDRIPSSTDSSLSLLLLRNDFTLFFSRRGIHLLIYTKFIFYTWYQKGLEIIRHELESLYSVHWHLLW